MKKINPNDIQIQFAENLTQLLFVFKLSSRTIVRMDEKYKLDGKNLPFNRNELLSLLAEQSMLSAAIKWECFVSDLFVCYVNRDSAKYTAELKSRFQMSVRDKFGEELANQALIQLGKHLTKKQVQHFLDPKKYNLTVKNAKDLIAKSTTWLNSEHSSKFTALTKGEMATIDAWYEMRNYLAHKSLAAWDEMERALKNPLLFNNYRWRKKARHDVGAYLRASVTKDRKSRLERYLLRMKGISVKLATT